MSTGTPRRASAPAARCSCPASSASTATSPAGAVVELLDVRHPERLLGRGSVALPSAILRLLRALSPQEVACVISILLRLRYGGLQRSAEVTRRDAGGERSGQGDRTWLLDPDVYKDCRELADGTSRASQEASPS